MAAAAQDVTGETYARCQREIVARGGMSLSLHHARERLDGVDSLNSQRIDALHVFVVRGLWVEMDHRSRSSDGMNARMVDLVRLGAAPDHILQSGSPVVAAVVGWVLDRLIKAHVRLAGGHSWMVAANTYLGHHQSLRSPARYRYQGHLSAQCKRWYYVLY